MEKNTVLAVTLTFLIVIGWFFMQAKFNSKQAEQTTAQDQPLAEQEAPVLPQGGPIQPGIINPVIQSADAGSAGSVNAGGNPEEIGGEFAAQEPEMEERVVIETDLIRVEFSSVGGDMVSYRLKEHNDKGEVVEMILPAVNEDGTTKESHAFTTAFGGKEGQPLDAHFQVSRPTPLSVEFSRDFSIIGYPGTLTLIKRFEFRDGEYMFQLSVSMESTSSIPFNFGNAAYTLGFGPQIGPSFQKLDNRYEYRQYYTLVNGKRSNARMNSAIDSRFTWAAIAGKYFTAIVIPDNTLYTLSFSDKSEPGIPAVSRMHLIRPPLNSARSDDVFYFYLGPKNQENLGRYDTGDNSFKLRDQDLSKAASTSGILTPLESLLKWLLLFFYKLVHNYGTAIILLTLTVKLLTFPLTKKSSEASIKMQTLAPKIKEIQAKYKDNPTKMNAEMGALYKKEGHNPMSGCLPLLIQMPLLFAMYNLFNNHFDLRGAMFIPGWIPDLSLPESVLDFGFSLPLLGWESLRILPFIYVGSQLLYGFATRTPEQQGNSTMKMMMYAMPVMFFFILYNVPSGLLVFWIFSNLFTLVQQVVLNKYLAGKRAAVVVEGEKPPIIAPRHKKKH